MLTSSSDLKNLITETTDGVAAWKILKITSNQSQEQGNSTIKINFLERKYQPGEDVGIFISRVKTAATRRYKKRVINWTTCT
ncbi:hypothetical protein TNCV_2806101 [Trichonephila clavipes]|nr:hypothetical protein TNCV_2806101 [Trichonephila clavipes]